MKYILISLLIFISSIRLSFSQKRYYDEGTYSYKFTKNICYGENKNFLGFSIEKLYLDIYEPQFDTLAQRPLIIFIHGGGFTGMMGDKNAWSMEEMCKRFASMGYVTATIDYREGFEPNISNPINAVQKAVFRAVHDLKAAIRFFRRDADKQNIYKINPNLIIATGESAGAITAVHATYVDKEDELNKLQVSLSEIGGFDGKSGNPGYSSDLNYVICLSGAIGDTSWIEEGDQPIACLHGDNDQTVPFEHSNAFSILPVYGGACIAERTKNLGNNYFFHNFKGQDHVPFHIAKDSVLYMDTTITMIKEFLYPKVIAGVVPNKENSSIRFAKNSENTGFYVIIDQELTDDILIEIYDYSGKKVFSRLYKDYENQEYIASQFFVPIGKIPYGIYIVRAYNSRFDKSGKIILSK